MFIPWARCYEKCRSALRAFARARDGNVAITFAILLVPVVATAGAAIDYSRANSVKADLQAALDTTALMLSKEAATDTPSQLQTNAAAYFKAAFNRPSAQNISISATYSTTNGPTVVVNGSVSVPTTFMGILGYNAITVSSSSTTEWGTSRLRVALVLDNTGSMRQAGKMTALKTATKNLLSQLQSAATTDGDVYVSIIPFVKDVNFGTANYTADWIDWTEWDAKNGTCQGGGRGSNSDQTSCQNRGGTWKPKNHNSWNGCVVDRGDASGPSTGDYDTNVVAPSTTITATLYAAEPDPKQYACPQAAMGLSYDWTKMNSLVNSMQPNGWTNQAIGLQAGWMSLAGGGPFTAPYEDPNYTYQKVIILLTDGLNTKDRWKNYGQSQIDARQEMTCNNIKAAGITLYTIQVDTGGDPTSTLLQNCASSSDKFYLLTSANQIVTTFDSIATHLSKLRVAK